MSERVSAELSKRVADIETRVSLIIDVLADVSQRTVPDAFSFSLYALVAGFTAEEVHAVIELFQVAALSDEISIADFEKVFAEKLPRRADALRAIAQGFAAETKFSSLCERILSSGDSVLSLNNDEA